MRTIAPVVAVLVLAVFLAPAFGVAGVPYAVPVIALFWLLVGVPMAAQQLRQRRDAGWVWKTAALVVVGAAVVIGTTLWAFGK